MSRAHSNTTPTKRQIRGAMAFYAAMAQPERHEKPAQRPAQAPQGDETPRDMSEG